MMRDKCGGKKHIDGIGQNIRLVEKEKIKQKEESAGIKNKNVFFFFFFNVLTANGAILPP